MLVITDIEVVAVDFSFRLYDLTMLQQNLAIA